MEKERVKKILVELYNDFQHELIAEEKRGSIEAESRFDSLLEFMTFIHNK